MVKPKIKFFREQTNGSPSARKFGFKKFQTIEDQEKERRGSKLSPAKFNKTRKGFRAKKRRGRQTNVFVKIAGRRGGRRRVTVREGEKPQDLLFG